MCFLSKSLMLVLLGLFLLSFSNGASGTYLAQLEHLPEYYVLGCQKCGTTSLHNYIKEQKGYCFFKEEIHSFEGDCRNPWEYDKIFGSKTKRRFGCLKFDNTPSNFYYDCFYRFLEETSGFNILVVFRDPIDRFVSSFNMVVEKYNRDHHKHDKIVNFNQSFIHSYLAESFRAIGGITARYKSCYDPVIPKLVRACKRHNCKFVDFSELLESREVVNEMFGLEDRRFPHSNKNKRFITREDLSEESKNYLKSCNLLYYSWEKSNHNSIQDFFDDNFESTIQMLEQYQ